MIIVRYADDMVVGFEHETDARRFCDAMRERLEEFSLSLHPEKTRLIEFGRYAAAEAQGAGSVNRKPSSSWGSRSSAANPAGATSSSNGNSARPHAGEAPGDQGGSCGDECTMPIPEQGKWLRQVVTGIFAYLAVPTNSRALRAFRHQWSISGTTASAAQPEGQLDLGADGEAG